jgi:prophage regulatory protein
VPNDQVSLLRLPAVLGRTGLSRSQLYRLIARGAFPRPIRLAGTASAAWSSDAVSQWVEQQLNQDAARA